MVTPTFIIEPDFGINKLRQNIAAACVVQGANSKKCSRFEIFNKRRIAMENDELYMGGFRCSMCNWFDETKNNYFILNWFVAILHPIVHSIEAHKALG